MSLWASAGFEDVQGLGGSLPGMSGVCAWVMNLGMCLWMGTVNGGGIGGAFGVSQKMSVREFSGGLSLDVAVLCL